MDLRALLVAGLALTLSMATPASAKSPTLTTVTGPGIAGEVDLRSLFGDDAGSLVLPVSREVAEAGGEPPPHDPGPGYVFTWYSVRDMPPEAALDQVVYHPEARGGPVIEVVSVSELFVPTRALGWHRLDPGPAAALDAAVAAASDGALGAERYAFAGVEHAEATGEWWVPVASFGSEAVVAHDAPASPDRPGSVDGWALIAAALVAVGAAAAVAMAARRPSSATSSDTFGRLNRVPGK